MILLEKKGPIALLTLNRPEMMNAIGQPGDGESIAAACAEINADLAIRCTILTGAGRAFCAGADLEHLAAHAKGQNVSKGPRLGEEDFLRELPLEMRAASKPVLAAINGPAVGVGMTMAMPCDVRIAAEDAKLGFVFGRLGILPGLGSTHLLPQLVGMARAQELVLTAKKILGTEAAAIGLVNKAVPADQVLPTARAMAKEMAEIDPIVLAFAKQALQFGAAHTMAQAMKNEQSESARLKAAREAAKAR